MEMLALVFVVLFICATPTRASSTGRKYQNILMQQNFQTALTSIEEKLNGFPRNIGENTRKLDALENKLECIEANIGAQFEKIFENTSNGQFKEDIARQHVLRKIDSVYERINHRLVYIEMKIEMSEKKLMDKLELMLTKFEKLEDSLTSRDGDMEEDVADVLAVADEIKSGCTNLDGNDIATYINKSMQVISNQIKMDVIQLNGKVEKGVELMRDQIARNINETLDQLYNHGEDLKMALNENINKVIDLYENSMKVTEMIHQNVKTISQVVNSSRIEQQNGLRNLIVQVGRLGGKNAVQSDGNKDNIELKTLNDKLDNSFQNVMLLQNLFLESCHRVQMDETQLESKISEVLEKLIDTFESKTAIELKDLQNVENQIKSQDALIRRNMYTNSHNFGILVQKGKEQKEEIRENIKSIQTEIKKMFGPLEDLIKHNQNQLNPIMECLWGVEKQLKAMSTKMDTTNAMQVFSQTTIGELWKSIRELSVNASTVHKIHNNQLQNILSGLNNVTKKLNSMQIMPGELLLQRIEDIVVGNLPKRSDNSNLDDTIRSIFGENPNIKPRNTTLDDEIKNIFGENPVLKPIVFGETTENCNEFGMDVRNGQECKPNKTITSGNMEFINLNKNPNNTLPKNFIKNATEMKENCNEFGIDVRNGGKCNPNNTLPENFNKNTTEILFFELNENCNEFGIDIRSGIECSPNKTLIDGVNKTLNFNSGNESCNEFGIDVRNGGRCSPNKTVIQDNLIFREENEDCNEFGIDVRSGNECQGNKINATHIKNCTDNSCTDLYQTNINCTNKTECGKPCDLWGTENGKTICITGKNIQCNEFTIDEQGRKICKELIPETKCNEFGIDPRSGTKCNEEVTQPPNREEQFIFT